MSTQDKSGRPWAKLSQLTPGDKIAVDRTFGCMRGRKTVYSDGGGMYVACDDGKHYIAGQADDGEHLIGCYKV